MKRVLSVLLALCLMLGTVSPAAQAAKIPGQNDVSTVEGFLNRLCSAHMYNYDCEKLSDETGDYMTYADSVLAGMFYMLSGLHLETYGMKREPYNNSMEKLPLADAKWLCLNILNWTEQAWNEMLAQTPSYKYLSVNNGYLCGSSPAGIQFGEGIKVVKQQKVGSRQEIMFDWVYKGFELEASVRGRFFAVVEKKSISGKQYWTLYSLKNVESGEDPFTPPEPTVGGFTDVTISSPYKDGILWAVEQGVTNGIGGGKFGPNNGCTRAQIATFLWRANSKPQAAQPASFSDIPQSGDFYDAISWAVEQGVTNGVGGNKFDPNTTCTRAQAVTLIWRAAGRPKASQAATFTDIPQSGDFYDAISWAVEKGVTNGVGGNRFAPNDTCTRGQIVTFLYRADQ